MCVFGDSTVIHTGEVVVDDVLNILHVNATSGDARGNENGRLSTAKSPHGILSLTLGAVRVHRGAGKLLVVEVVVQLVSGAFVVHKNDDSSRLNGKDQVKEGSLLECMVHPDDVLLDVLVRAADTANTDANVRLCHVSLGQLPDGSREGS